MFEIKNWEQDLEKINAIVEQEKKIESLIKCFIMNFSLGEAMIFRYSPIDHLAEGILSATITEFKSITSIRDDVSTIPAIFEAIQTKNPRYFVGNDFHLNISRKYIISENQNALFVVPIIFNHVVIGYFLSPQINTPFNHQLESEANLFGRKVGEILFNYSNYIESNEIKLSNREYEVMRCIAFGYSTKQIAQLLEISETTIKQYIKSVMAKTKTLNRTHAVAFLFQNRILN